MTTEPGAGGIIQLLRENRNKGAARELLRHRRLPFRGPWEDVEGYIEESVSYDKISEDEWLDLVDAEEEAGNQHIFLYQCRRSYLKSLTKEGVLQEKVKRAGLEHLWNRSRLLYLPQTPTVSSIDWDGRRLKFKWVERRVWKERIGEREEREENRVRVITEYQTLQARGIAIFILDFTTARAQFRIQRFKSRDRDSSYLTKLEFFWQELQQVVDRGQLKDLCLVKTVDALTDPKLDEIRRRDSQVKTQLRMNLGAKSPRGTDVNQEKMWIAAVEKGKGQYVGSLAYVEWLRSTSNVITKDIGVKVFRDRNELIVYAKCREAELEHVLSRIIDLN